MKHARLSAKPWTTAEDDRLRSLAISGMNAWGIAAELERTVAAVRSRAERFGLSLRRVTVAPSRRLVARPEKGKMEPMAGLRRYVEWMNRGRRTDRVVYVAKEWNMPKPVPGAEWQLDTKFKLADELLRDPDLKTVVKAALEKGAEVVIQKHRWDE